VEASPIFWCHRSGLHRLAQLARDLHGALPHACLAGVGVEERVYVGGELDVGW
jgi:hypothetical protein